MVYCCCCCVCGVVVAFVCGVVKCVLYVLFVQHCVTLSGVGVAVAVAL